MKQLTDEQQTQVEKLLPVARWVASKYPHLEDAGSIAMEALCKSVLSYPPNHDTPLRNWCISNIRTALSRAGRPAHVHGAREDAARIWNHNHTDVMDTPEERRRAVQAQYPYLRPEQVAWAVWADCDVENPPIINQPPVRSEEKKMVQKLDAGQKPRIIVDWLDSLTPKVREACKRYYLQQDAMTAIGEDMGITRQRVHQMTQQGFEKLQTMAAGYTRKGEKK